LFKFYIFFILKVEPLCLAYDANKVAEMVEKKYGRPLSDPYGKMCDVNSMYPGFLLPDYSHSERPLDYVMTPVGGHKVLLGRLECNKKCNLSCKIRCRREDAHECKENVNCYQTCDTHHPSSDWGKLPGVALVKILPPKNQRFPILRMRLKGDNSEKNFSTLCYTCALQNDPFEGVKECLHSDTERALFGEFTTGV
jgi:hypothetical protein